MRSAQRYTKSILIATRIKNTVGKCRADTFNLNIIGAVETVTADANWRFNVAANRKKDAHNNINQQTTRMKTTEISCMAPMANTIGSIGTF